MSQFKALADQKEYSIPLQRRLKKYAELQPEHVALADERGTVSYGRLYGLARDLAAFLIRRGLGPGDSAAVMLTDNRWKVTTLFGALLAGAAWTPLDIRQPLERRRVMLEEARSRVLISDRARLADAGRLMWNLPGLETILIVDAESRDQLVEEDRSGELWEFFAGDAGDLIKISGWKDAWTGRWLTPEVMEDYVADSVGTVLKALEPDILAAGADVLEIGCGSGLIMRRLAPEVGGYLGLDIAPTAVRRAAAEAEKAGLKNVSFQTIQASKLDALGTSRLFDLVLASSVIQSFPGFGYLRAMLDGARRRLKPGGRLVLCDVWDAAAREAWERSLLDYAAVASPDETTTFPGDDSLFVPREFLSRYAAEHGLTVEFCRSTSPTWAMAPYVYNAVFRPGEERRLDAPPKDIFCRADMIDSADQAEPPAPDLDDSAYIFFTSGSTGRPKGVRCSQGNLANLTASYRRRLASILGPGANDAPQFFSFCQGYPFHFDACLVMLSQSLGYGHVFHIPSETTLSDPALFSRYLIANRISVVEMTPSRGGMVLNQLERSEARFDHFKIFGFGGEMLPLSHLERLYNLPGTGEAWIHNGYGPTECSVSSLACFLNKDDWNKHPFAPLGEPIDNSEVLLLNDRLRPVPPGLVGELVVVGANVGQGYLDPAAEGAARFIELADASGAVRRAYRTGDLARRRADGALEFVRRNDGQMKVQGYRVETGDVVEALLRCPKVIGAAVKLGDFLGDGVAALAAYVVSADQSAWNPQAVYDRLRRLLPDYSVPGWIVPVKELPLTPNGKVDLSRLPDPVAAVSGGPQKVISPPEGETELKLAAIWGRLLKIETERLEAEESFFTMGGYSLMVLRLLSLVEEAFEVQVAVADFFSCPTIRHLARLVERELARGGPEGPKTTLIPVRTSGRRPPLCCFHPVGGNVGPYRDLAALLPPDRPVYMLQNPGLESGEAPLESIEELAELHIQGLRRELSGSPLALFGWSMGGLVAWEAARRLRALGEEVTGIVLLDTPAVTSSLRRTMAKDEAGLLADLFTGVIPLAAEELRGLQRDGRGVMIDHIISLGRARGVYSREMDTPTLRRIFDVYAANGRAVLAYEIPPQNIPALLIRPRPGTDPLPYMPTKAPEDYGWSAYSASLRLGWISGSHNTVFESPHLESAASQTLDFLNECEKN